MLSPHLPRSAASARLLLEVAVENGMGSTSALRGTGLNAAQLGDPHTEIRSAQEQRLIQNMVGEFGTDSDIALIAGSRYSLGVFGMLGFACMSAPTMRDTLEITLRYQDLTFTLARAEQKRTGSMTYLCIDPSQLPQEIRRFVVDHAIATAWVALSDLNRAPLTGARIELTRPRPPYAERYRELLSVEPTFGARANHVALQDAFLDQPRPQADPVALEMCERDCRSLLARRQAKTGAKGIVHERLSRAAGVMPSMEMMARDLNVSVRTLRRSLSAEGTSFREIDEAARRQRAETLLLDGQSLEQIANSLGYATSAVLVRAFRRWHRTTPGRWRKAALAEKDN